VGAVRGLTPLERRVLLDRASNRRQFVYYGSPEYHVIDVLKAHGRMDEVELHDHWMTNLTDLGRLALRVCPVDES
jgi:hypothetical protein